MKNKIKATVVRGNLNGEVKIEVEGIKAETISIYSGIVAHCMQGFSIVDLREISTQINNQIKKEGDNAIINSKKMVDVFNKILVEFEKGNFDFDDKAAKNAS